MFKDVYKAVSNRRSLPKGHPLYYHNIYMYIDSDYVLHISSCVSRPDSSQPRTLIPLSLKSYLTKLLVTTLNTTYSHAGVSTLLCLLASDYHIPGLKNFLKGITRKCVTCQKALARPMNQQMGLLPQTRTMPSP